jgi:hypothetical protein
MKVFQSSLLFFVAASLCPQLRAGPIYPDCATLHAPTMANPGADSLESYIQSSGCILGEVAGADVVFSGFTFSVANNPDGLNSSTGLLDPTEITLTPVASGLSGSFDFSGNFSVPAGDTVTYDIDYILLLDPPPILGGGSLFLDPTGDVSVTQSICADSYFDTISPGDTVCQYNTPNGPVDSAPQSLTVDDSNPPYSLSASIVLNPGAYNFANIDTQIVLTGGTTGASSGGVTATDTVYAAPEPMTALLCLGGLTVIGCFRRRFFV